jgi:hypothetical protein
MKASDGVNLCRAETWKGKDSLLARVWHRIGLILFQPLHARSWLFMTTLMGQSY